MINGRLFLYPKPPKQSIPNSYLILQLITGQLDMSHPLRKVQQAHWNVQLSKCCLQQQTDSLCTQFGCSLDVGQEEQNYKT